MQSKYAAKNSIDLGLAIAGLHAYHGQEVLTYDQIAAFCCWNPTAQKWENVSPERIRQIADA